MVISLSRSLYGDNRDCVATGSSPGERSCHRKGNHIVIGGIVLSSVESYRRWGRRLENRIAVRVDTGGIVSSSGKWNYIVIARGIVSSLGSSPKKSYRHRVRHYGNRIVARVVAGRIVSLPGKSYRSQGCHQGNHIVVGVIGRMNRIVVERIISLLRSSSRESYHRWGRRRGNHIIVVRGIVRNAKFTHEN